MRANRLSIGLSALATRLAPCIGRRRPAAAQDLQEKLAAVKQAVGAEPAGASQLHVAGEDRAEPQG